MKHIGVFQTAGTQQLELREGHVAFPDGDSGGGAPEGMREGHVALPRREFRRSPEGIPGHPRGVPEVPGGHYGGPRG